MSTPLQLLRELVESAILWLDTKDAYLAESKKDPQNEKKLAKARKTHLQAVARLDNAARLFKKLPEAMRKLTKRKKPLDWKQVIDIAASVTGAVSRATNKTSFANTPKDGALPPIDMANVIDVQAEEG